MRHYFITLICVLALASCAKKQDDGAASHQTWDCTSFNSSKPYDFRKDYPNSHFVKLEDGPEAQIGMISKLLVNDSLLIILDKDFVKKVLVFKPSTGKFLNSIGQTGSGPDEYSMIKDISYDSKNGTIHALCDRDKVFVYNLDGELTSSRTAPCPASFMEYNDGRYYFFSSDDSCEEITVADTAMNVVASFFPNAQNPIVHTLLHPFQKHQNGDITYVRYMDNNIYRINDADSIEIKYAVDFGDTAYTREMAEADGEDKIRVNMRNKRGSIKYYTENEREAAIVFFDNAMPCMSILNKETGESTNIPLENICDSFLGRNVSPIEFATPDGLIMVLNPAATEPGTPLAEAIDDSNENPIIYYLAR